MIDWSKYPNFSNREFMCPCGCGRADMNESFLADLQDLRATLDFAFVVTSGFRCDEYNTRKGYGPAHPTGNAADIAIFGERAFKLVTMAAGRFITGIGIKQHGPMRNRFIHLDQLIDGETRAPRPRIWTYG